MLSMSRIDRYLLGDRFSTGRKEFFVPSAGSASMVMCSVNRDKGPGYGDPGITDV